MRAIALIVRAGAVVVARAFVFSLLVDGGAEACDGGAPTAAVETRGAEAEADGA